MRSLRLLLTLVLGLALMGARDWRNTQQRRDEFLQQLKRDIVKVDKSIAITKDLIARSKGEKYLPDLQFRLAELYVTKSRLLYFKVLEEAGLEDKHSITAPESRLLKGQAIQTYRRILADFPTYKDNDKIRFFIAHELRELGEFEQMIKEYLLLVEQYPESKFRHDAWLVLGDYYFDKADLDSAESYYKKILATPESHAHNLARYKLAWCHVNRERCKEALELFEKVVISENVDVNQAVQIDKQSRQNVRREALVDSAFCYTEVKKPSEAVAFYRRLAASRQDYLAAIEKLARRYSIKGDPAASAMLYREAMAVSNDVEHNMELAFRIYEMVQQSKKRQDTDRDVELLIQAAARYRFSWRTSDDQKRDTLEDVELITRDLATKLQLEAQQKDNAKLHARAARAYKAYLSLFSDAPQAIDMRWNYAEALFESAHYVEAGQAYEDLIRAYDTKTVAPAGPKAAPAKAGDGKKRKADAEKVATRVAAGGEQGERKKAMYSAVISYFQALRKPADLSRLDETLAREGIKNLGVRFVEEYPKDEYVSQVKFNVARAFYEQGELGKAKDLFLAFAREYPTNKDAWAAANLALDAMREQENFMELAKQARELAKIERLGDAAKRQELLAMASSADQQEIDRRTIESQGNLKQALQDIIREKKGTDVAAKALYQAFAIAKDRRDVDSMQEVGQEIIAEYPDTTYTQAVLPALGEMAIQSGEFERGASYYEEYARRFPKEKGAMDLLGAAADLRLALGDRSGAMAAFEKLLREGDEEKRSELRIKLARTAIEARVWRRAADAANELFEDKDYSVVARTIAGEGLLRSGDTAAAARLFGEASGMAGKGDGDSRQAGSRAQFFLGEIVRRDFDSVKFGAGDDNAVLEQRFARLDQLSELYGASVQLGDPESAIGSLYRLSQAYRSTADMLDNAPMPEGLSDEEKKGYRAALAERSGPMRQQGDELLKACKEKALQLRVFSPYTKACLLGAVPPDEPGPPPARPNVEIPGAAELRAKLRANPKDQGIMLELGKRALGVGDPYAARVFFSRVLEMNENSAEAHNGLGAALYATGDAQGAYFQFVRAVKADGSFAPAHHNLSILYAEYGDTARANSERSTAGGAPPQTPEIIRPLGGGA